MTGAATRFLFDAEVRRRSQIGGLDSLDAGRITLAEYVAGSWAVAHGASLAPATRKRYGYLYDRHVLPELGPLELRQISPEVIARWQADRLACGSGPVAVHDALTLLGGILQRAVEGRHLVVNPARAVRRAPLPRRSEVPPLAPISIERMRACADARNATLISVLAYAGLRPGEALALQWRDIRERTILVEKAIALGEDSDTKTTAHRTVRLLAPLAADLREWRLRSGRPPVGSLVFPSREGGLWSLAAYQSWRRKAHARARAEAGLEHGRPYDLRHSFASLLLHEGRSVIYVARQLGHDPRLTLATYGHVIEELDGAPQIGAEEAILAARKDGAEPDAAAAAT